MEKFEKAIMELINKIEDIAGELYDNEEVKAFFKDRYGYQEGIDDEVYTVLNYMMDRFI